MGLRFKNIRFFFILLLLTGCASIPDQATDGTDPQLKCLAEVVYGEARGESRAGKLFVARVVLTRVKKGFAPNICAAVYAPSQFAPRRGYYGPQSLAAARDAMKLGPNGITHFHSYKSKRTSAASFTKSPLCQYKTKVGGHWGYTCNEKRAPASLSGDVPSVKSRP